MNSEELKELRATVAGLLMLPPESVLPQLAELGWDDFVEAEPEDAITILFSENGRSLGKAALLDQVLIARLGKGADGIGAMGYRALGAQADNEFIILQPATPSTVIAVPAVDGSTVLSFLAEDAEVRSFAAFDSSLPWLIASPHSAVLTPLEGVDWRSAEREGRKALAAEILGIAREMLRLAIEYTSSRVQYGHPIGAFQTVRHRLADCHAAIEGASAVLSAAFASDSIVAAASAKAIAVRACDLTARHVIQVFGAIGSTSEHVLHRYVGRAAMLDQLLGNRYELTRLIGSGLLTHDPITVLGEL